MNLNTQVLVVDKFGPEEIAMIQALYSRSPASATSHIAQVEKDGPEAFMKTWYVEYNHKSIGDCGTTTIFIEGVSMLAAKAIQDWPLYNGQEASTRYLDMSQQAVINSSGSMAGRAVQNTQMLYYESALDGLIDYLTAKYPKLDGESKVKYKKAIKAKAFDIARGFLPAGVTTNVAWHTNLRQAADHLGELFYHPLSEVKAVAKQIWNTLAEKYPSSFSHAISLDDEFYKGMYMREFTYHVNHISDTSDVNCHDKLERSLLEKYRDVLEKRPKRSELPHWLRICGNFEFGFYLDFGSYRDLQRQRSVIQPMPMLTIDNGFEKWYIDQLPETMIEKATEHLKWVELRLKYMSTSGTGANELQYYVPMGYRVPCMVSAPLPAAVYVAELRAGQTVHPTLRVIAQQMAAFIEDTLKNDHGIDMKIYADMNPDEWSIKRGSQDIVKIGEK